MRDYLALDPSFTWYQYDHQVILIQFQLAKSCIWVSQLDNWLDFNRGQYGGTLSLPEQVHVGEGYLHLELEHGFVRGILVNQKQSYFHKVNLKKTRKWNYMLVLF